MSRFICKTIENVDVLQRMTEIITIWFQTQLDAAGHIFTKTNRQQCACRARSLSGQISHLGD
jgi:hypothetical protein